MMRSSPAPGRRGGALLMALILATSVAVLAATVMQISAHFTRRQLKAEHDSRAFYLAEAGLSEAYYSLTSGGSGRIGSAEAPARSGGGVLWVEATDLADGRVRLECTALAGMGRAALAITVERVEQPLGIFADQDIVVGGPLLVDGYDSEVAPYEEQVVKEVSYPGAGTVRKVEIDDNRKLFVVGKIIYFSGGYYNVVKVGQEMVTLSYMGDGYQPSGSTDLSPSSTDAGGTTYASDSTSTTSPVAGPHTSGGGLLASNGSITFQADGAVFGDVAVGPDAALVKTPGTLVSGSVQQRAQRVQLEPVAPPDLALQPALEHGGVVPLVIPPSRVGYAGLRVLSGAEVIVRGPSVMLIGALEVLDAGQLTVDNLDGRVDLYVTQSLDLAPGSLVDVAHRDPSRLTVQVVGAASPIRLAASGGLHGLFYAPEAHVRVEAPFELFGVLAVRSLDLGAGARLHFDSGFLGGSGPLSLPRLISWEVTEVPAALRVTSIDATTLLALDSTTLSTPQDAQETMAWMATCRYYNKQGALSEYDGPYGEFPDDQIGFPLSFQLVPPEYKTVDPWTISLRYLDLFSKEKTWEGSMPSFSTSWMMLGIKTVLQRTLTPPPELQAKGYVPITKTFL